MVLVGDICVDFKGSFMVFLLCKNMTCFRGQKFDIFECHLESENVDTLWPKSEPGGHQISRL